MLKYLTFACFILIALLIVSPALAGQLTSIQINDLEGNEVKTGDFLGENYVVFEVWTTWCPSCVVSLRDFQKNLELFKEKNIEIVAISLDDRVSTVKNFIENNEIEFTVLHDPRSRAAMQWNVRAIPAVFIVSPEGELLLRKEGYAGFDSFWEEINEVIEAHRETNNDSKKNEEGQSMHAFDLEVVELDTEFFREFYDFFEFKPMEELSGEYFEPVEGAVRFYHFFIGNDDFLAITLNQDDNGLPQHIHLAPFDEESQESQTLHLEYLGKQNTQKVSGIASEIQVTLASTYRVAYHIEAYIWENGMAGYYALPNEGYRGRVVFEGLGEKEILLVDLGGNTFFHPAQGYILVDLAGDGNFSNEGIFRLSNIVINGHEFQGELDIENMQVKIARIN